jgi:hypothetical protein
LAVALVLLSLSGWAAACGRPRGTTVGFWFEDVTYQSPALGGALTESDLARIKTIALAEVQTAFAGLGITVSTRQDARCRVRVVQEVPGTLVHSAADRPAGRSRTFPGGGGEGAVSFEFAAGGALVYAPAGATREEMVAAIGRGTGRAAVHETLHQLLPRAPIDRSQDTRSYEYYSGARVEQFYGPMFFDFARPMLEKRYGRATDHRQ